jgi:hypothetical protein
VRNQGYRICPLPPLLNGTEGIGLVLSVSYPYISSGLHGCAGSRQQAKV